MKKAYVLINCDLGKEEDILDTLRSMKSIKEAHGTSISYGVSPNPVSKLITKNERINTAGITIIGIL